MGWKVERSEFESQYGQYFCFLKIVQTGSVVHPTSYTMGTGGSFPVKSGRGVKLTTLLQLLPRSKFGSIYPLP
jgi:hypothetical protein